MHQKYEAFLTEGPHLAALQLWLLHQLVLPAHVQLCAATCISATALLLGRSAVFQACTRTHGLAVLPALHVLLYAAPFLVDNEARQRAEELVPAPHPTTIYLGAAHQGPSCFKCKVPQSPKVRRRAAYGKFMDCTSHGSYCLSAVASSASFRRCLYLGPLQVPGLFTEHLGFGRTRGRKLGSATLCHVCTGAQHTL